MRAAPDASMPDGPPGDPTVSGEAAGDETVRPRTTRVIFKTRRLVIGPWTLTRPEFDVLHVESGVVP